MPTRRGLQPKPSDYLGHGVWPTGSLRKLTNQEQYDDWSGDVLDVVHFVKTLAMKLEERRESESIYKMANNANVHPLTLANFIRGKTWGDVVIIFRLERGIKRPSGATTTYRRHRGRATISQTATTGPKAN